MILSTSSYARLPMGGWRMHSSYSNITEIEVGRDKVYALCNGALMSVDKEDGSIEYYNKVTGLSSSNITCFRYDKETGRIILTYADGNIDILDDNGYVINISDMYLSQTSENKTVNDILISDRTAYLAMRFGILQLDLQRREIKDTYYIGDNATAVNIQHLTICNDTLYALSTDTLYFAALSSNKIDYRNWKTVTLPSTGAVAGLETVADTLYLLQDNKIYRYSAQKWIVCQFEQDYHTIRSLAGTLTAISPYGTDFIKNDLITHHISSFAGARDIDYDPQTQIYWYPYFSEGVGAYYINKSTYNLYKPNGPVSNKPYRLRFTGNRLYMVPGGYWAVKDNTISSAMFYENEKWTNYDYKQFYSDLGYYSYDYSDILGDPNDPTHFFICAFSVGLLEFRNNKFYKLHDVTNSPFVSMIADNPRTYTWVDGLVFDSQGNLFVHNCFAGCLCMLTPDGKWFEFRNKATLNLTRTKQVLISNKNPNIKIIVCNIEGAGIGVMDDNGTLANEADDRAVFRHEFVDQNGNSIIPENIYYIEQDKDGELWVGTSAGIVIIPNVEQLFTSNDCKRVIIPRTDGSGLADYLLSDEQINAIAVDGANRKWIGTQESGLYLLSADGTETIEHFTTDNSLLPDNSILSIAINSNSGEVFIGTGIGLVSYQSDAADGEEQIPNSELYVYPNPVYDKATITITGLRDNTTVKITDVAGNLVAETHSLGSLAIWDGKDSSGAYTRSGVYLMQCLTSDGKQYAITKVLIIK